NTYSIPAAGIQNVGNYDVIASNSMGSVTSLVARLVVGLPLLNPSFEVDSFLSWPGYSGDNPGNANTPAGPNIPITGWTQSAPERSGINPVSDGGSPFADNGTIPNGKQVAFLQTSNPTDSTDQLSQTLSQTVTGLTVGSQYYLHYYENSRAATLPPTLEAALGSSIAVPAHTVPSGNYREVFSDVFSAASTSLDLTFTASGPAQKDTTALIDNVAIVSVASGTAPVVIRNPATASVHFTGDKITLSAQLIGSLPFSYQWLKNGSPIVNATNVTLTLNNIQTTAAGDYSLKVSNSGGSVTTPAATLTIYPAVPGLFNTGVDSNRVALADGEIDPHFQLIVNPGMEDSTSAIVEDSTTFPIVAGPWLPNTAISKWIGPELNTVNGAVGLFTYRTVIDLTNLDPQSVVILGQWATDNAGRNILVNGVSTGNPENPGFSAYTPFAIYGTNTTFVAGTNSIDFVVENVDAVGYTGLKMEILQSNVLPAGSTGTGATLHITRNGTSLSISWTGTAAGQKLQSATDIQGPWTDVPNATNPYSTTAVGTKMFFRVAQ
ncbi:MAG: Endoglucanase, partial [Verrucomicrobiales bacterium]|nr:Endoglucanase [Verrucomicrobiales bacterium]